MRRRSPSTPASSVEARSAAFHAWERPGRGWAYASVPVELEPPFTWPQIHETRALVKDDARVQRLPFRALGAAWRALQALRPSTQVAPAPTSLQLHARESMAMLELVLPAAGGRTPETGLLDAIPAMRTRLAFEVLATHERIQLLLTAPKREQRALRQQLRAHLPQLALRSVEDPVVPAWAAHEAQGSLILEFGLGSEWMRPLWTQGSSPQHLLTSLMATLDDLDPGELALLQVQFQPCRAAWAQAASQALVTPDGSLFLVDAPEMMGLAKRKLASPLLAVGVRLGCCAAPAERAWQIAQGVARALGVFTADASNQLIPLDPGEAPAEDLRADLLMRTNHRVGMLLNQQELGYLVQLPGPDVQSEKLARSAGSTRPAPALVQGTGLLLGTNEHAGESVEVRLPQKLRSRHLHVLGASGTGKSTLLLQMALQDLSEGRGLAVIDPHGDLVDDLLARMPESRHDDLVLVDPSDPDHTVGFNVLSAQTDLERLLAALPSDFRRQGTGKAREAAPMRGESRSAIVPRADSDPGAESAMHGRDTACSPLSYLLLHGGSGK